MKTTYENFSFNGKNFHLATLDNWDGDDENFSFKFRYHDDTYMGIIENNYKFYGSILLGRRNKPNVFYLPIKNFLIKLNFYWIYYAIFAFPTMECDNLWYKQITLPCSFVP